MACGGGPMTEKTWHEHMLQQQNVAAHSSPFAAPGHVSAAGHYGYQPPAQMDRHPADKENAAMDFEHGMWPSAAGGHGPHITPAAGYLGVRKRGRDEVLFQDFKRRRLTEIDTNAKPASRDAMETECDPEMPVKPVAQASIATSAVSDLELRCRLLRALHGAEPYHWAGSAE